MSDFKIEVDVREAVDDLSVVEQKMLVAYLKEQLEDEFDQPLTEEEAKKAKYSNMEADVWVDIDDALWSMSSYDKRELYEELKEEYGEETVEDFPLGGGSYSEQEFGKVLAALWEDRFLLTEEQKARIAAITKEKFV